MYRQIVERKIRALFEAVNDGDAEPVIAGFARRFEHSFAGSHALGGSRHSAGATRLWYERMYRLLPDIRFMIERISVRGMPWNTVAIVEWQETNSATDGVRTTARGIHVVWIRWGKMVRLLIVPETHVLCATLERIAAKGISEARAEQITD